MPVAQRRPESRNSRWPAPELPARRHHSGGRQRQLLFFVVIGNSSSGGAVAPPLLPRRFALVSQWLPSGAPR
jgi:hypothetical protein